MHSVLMYTYTYTYTMQVVTSQCMHIGLLGAAVKKSPPTTNHDTLKPTTTHLRHSTTAYHCATAVGEGREGNNPALTVSKEGHCAVALNKIQVLAQGGCLGVSRLLCDSS